MPRFIAMAPIGMAGMMQAIVIEAATLGEAVAIAEARFDSKQVIVASGGEIVRTIHDLLIGGERMNAALATAPSTAAATAAAPSQE